VPTLRQIAERFKQCVRIKWIFVYISEAHAQDVWPISQLGPGREILAHKNIQERAKAAQRFNQEYQLSSFFHTLLLDNMQDDFDRTYVYSLIISLIVLLRIGITVGLFVFGLLDRLNLLTLNPCHTMLLMMFLSLTGSCLPLIRMINFFLVVVNSEYLFFCIFG